MNVGIIGSGGREHAICYMLNKSKKVSKIFCFPGNAGTDLIAQNVSLDPDNFYKLEKYCMEKNIKMLVVGPEKPLVNGIVDHFNCRKAIHHLNEGRIVIFAGGTGNPLVTTDSAASLRGIEIEADVILKATNVEGIYSADPNTHSEATLYDTLSYKDALDKELAVMDLSAFCQCRDHGMAIRVFNMKKPGALLRVVNGESEGTLVTN